MIISNVAHFIPVGAQKHKVSYAAPSASGLLQSLVWFSTIYTLIGNVERTYIERMYVERIFKLKEIQLT